MFKSTFALTVVDFTMLYVEFGSHFTVGVTRLLLLSSRVSLLVINLLTIRERVNLGTDHEKTYGGLARYPKNIHAREN